MNIKSITCPNCGAQLNVDENVSRVICEFCGSTVTVEDSRMEGFNREMGSMDAREKVAYEKAKAIDDLISPLCDYPRVLQGKTVLEAQRKNLSGQVTFCEKYGRIVTYVLCGLVSSLFLLALISLRANIVFFIVFAVLSVLSFPALALAFLKYWDNVKQGVQTTSESISAHAKTLNNFSRILEEHKDIVIPQNYRYPKALCFIRDHLRSQEAQTVEQAIYQYEALLRDEQRLAMQHQQVMMQQQQVQMQQQQMNMQRQQLDQMKRMQNNSMPYAGSSTVYVRQEGHSILLHLFLLFFCGIGLFTIPYYTFSKRHYWHL